MVLEAQAEYRDDYITMLYLGRYAALRIPECFRIDTATARDAVKKKALTIKSKGGLVRTVPLNDCLVHRLMLHLEYAAPGHKLFAADGQPTHKAIQAFQQFISIHRSLAQAEDSDRPMTFHGLRHTCAAEWYQNQIEQGQSAYQARKAVSRLLGHSRDDVTRIYLASLEKERSDEDG